MIRHAIPSCHLCVVNNIRNNNMKKFLHYSLTLGLLFVALPVLASHDSNPNDSACPITWVPQYGVACFGGTVACGVSSGGIPQCAADEPSCASGAIVNCDGCSCACSSGQVACSAGIVSSAGSTGASCQASQSCSDTTRTTSNACASTPAGACGGCLSGFTDTTPATTSDPCVGSRPFVTLSPFSVQTDDQVNPSLWINKTGAGNLLQLQQSGADRLRLEENGSLHIQGSGGDLYLNSGRAIRVDATGSSVLNLGNYVTSGTEFHATLHVEGTNLAELLFQQGSADRWALSVRPGLITTPSGGDFEIRRGTTGWPRVLAVDYNTGNITFDSQVQLANLATINQPVRGASLTGALYYNTTESEVRVYSGTSWGAIGGSGGGLSTSGDATPRTLPKFIGAPGALTLTNSLLSEIGSTLTVGTVASPASITATGCFGPVFTGVTSISNNGDLPLTGVNEGYRAGHNICAVAYSNAHMCSTAEILNSISCGNAAVLGATGFAWVSNGGPSLPTQTNDCLGWTYGGDNPSYNGVAWEFNANGGTGWSQSCSSNYSLACCR